MMRIGVVEDDPLHMRALTGYLERYGQDREVEIEVATFTDGADLLESYRPVYDILLLDIQMAGTDGLAAARAVRRSDPAVVIIFITSAPQYAIRGYEVSALGYLLKPLPYASFLHEIDRARAVLDRHEGTSLVLKEGVGVQRVPVRDIVYLESVGHRITVHLVDGEVTVNGTLKEMEPRLEPHGFYRSNSCYIVNLGHVVGVQDQDSLMSTGQALRVSRPRKKGFMRALTEHVAGTDA